MKECVFDEDFSPKKYIGVFNFISIRVLVDFDNDCEYVTIKQSLLVRKATSGTNGWCVYFDKLAQESFKYEDSNGIEIPSKIIEDKGHHYFAVINFNKNMQIGETKKFSYEVKEKVDVSILKAEQKRIKDLFLTRLYGSSCEDFECVIKLPKTYKLIKSIPQIKGSNNIYSFKSEVKKLDPIQLVLTIKKKWFNNLFGKDAHPIVWVIVSAVLSIIISLIFII